MVLLCDCSQRFRSAQPALEPVDACNHHAILNATRKLELTTSHARYIAADVLPWAHCPGSVVSAQGSARSFLENANERRSASQLWLESPGLH